MKRMVLKLAVFIVLGAIVNVAVAWGECIYQKEYYRAASRTSDHFDFIQNVVSEAINLDQNIGHGLPLHSLSSNLWVAMDNDYKWSWDGGILFDRSNHAYLLPLRPIFPGFAINTIFYAVVLWLLFAIPGSVRRVVRRRRGLCPRCGYDLRGSPTGQCPECGPPSRRAGYGQVV